MIIRRADQRGHADHGWLNTFHTFSFADYYDPQHMGFRVLRVINDDYVKAGHGFGMHPHRDMEIITYVLEGQLAHQDTMGNSSIIRPGEVQRMSAGTGVRHSEQNPSRTDDVHLLQIWILPEKTGLPPSYEQKTFPEAERSGQLRLVASPDGRQGSVTIHQNAQVYATVLGPGQTARHELAPGRHAWIHVARGSLRIGGEELHAGDGAAISEPMTIELAGAPQGEALLFDLP